MLTPSAFKNTYPWSSVLGHSEHEVVAQNVMFILARTGDTWRPLSAKEYTAERLRDAPGKEYAIREELDYLHLVAPYVASAEQAATFSPDWAQVSTNA